MCETPDRIDMIMYHVEQLRLGSIHLTNCETSIPEFGFSGPANLFCKECWWKQFSRRILQPTYIKAINIQLQTLIQQTLAWTRHVIGTEE